MIFLLTTTVTCAECGFERSVEDEWDPRDAATGPLVSGASMPIGDLPDQALKALGWSRDKHGRPICEDHRRA